jgi:hypothetical protein
MTVFMVTVLIANVGAICTNVICATLKKKPLWIRVGQSNYDP